VTAHGAARRTRELGIPAGYWRRSRRTRAVGSRAQPWCGLWWLACGALLCYFGERLVRTLLFGVKEADLRVFATGVLTLLVVSLLAAYLPARRAGRVDPAEALRTD
jgi:hypothetical protein